MGELNHPPPLPLFDQMLKNQEEKERAAEEHKKQVEPRAWRADDEEVALQRQAERQERRRKRHEELAAAAAAAAGSDDGSSATCSKRSLARAGHPDSDDLISLGTSNSSRSVDRLAQQRQHGAPVHLADSASLGDYISSLIASGAATATPAMKQMLQMLRSGRGAHHVPTQADAAKLRSNRYLQDFEELEMIGRGGFGEVVKVRNRVDGRTYAIKKIYMKHADDHLLLREVHTLSRLQHRHVVRYYQAWVEYIGGKPDAAKAHAAAGEQAKKNSSSSVPTSATDVYTSEMTSASYRLHSDSVFHDGLGGIDEYSVQTTMGNTSSNGFIMDGRSDDDFMRRRGRPVRTVTGGYSSQDYSSDDEGAESSDADDDEYSDAAYFTDDEDGGGEAGGEARSGPGMKPTDRDILYIQMDYCVDTLASVTREGRDYTDSDIWRMFRQIIEGLVYMHEMEVIHRDLKPTNIFLDGQHDVKIGDFGLATKALDGAEESDAGTTSEGGAASPARGRRSTVAIEDEHTAALGTAAYASPEQLSYDGNGKSRYDAKADMYALGIIFFEMWYIFCSAHERAVVLSDLREHCTFPDGFEEAHPIQAAIIRLLVRRDPAERPTALELLQSELLPPKMEDEYQEDLLRLLKKSGSSFKSQCVASLFTADKDPDLGQAAIIGNWSTVRQELNVELDRCVTLSQRVFVRYAAMMHRTGLMRPSTEVRRFDLGAAIDDRAFVMTPTGQIMCLRYDLRQELIAALVSVDEDYGLGKGKKGKTARVHRSDKPPLARIQDHFKVYNIAPVYRSSPAGIVRNVIQGVFDIIARLPDPAGSASAGVSAVQRKPSKKKQLAGSSPALASSAGVPGPDGDDTASTGPDAPSSSDGRKGFKGRKSVSPKAPLAPPSVKQMALVELVNVMYDLVSNMCHPLPVTIRFNHAAVGTAVLETARVPVALYGPVSQVLGASFMGKSLQRAINRVLDQAVPPVPDREKVVAALGRFGTFVGLEDRVPALVRPKRQELAKEKIAEAKELARHVEALCGPDVHRSLVFDPLLPPSQPFNCGFVFQAIVTKQEADSKADKTPGKDQNADREVVALGGEYSRYLLDMAALAGQQDDTNVFAAGVSFGTERLATISHDMHQGPLNTIIDGGLPPSIQVLVYTLVSSALDEQQERQMHEKQRAVVRELRAAGFSVDAMYKVGSSLEELRQYEGNSGALYVVVLRPTITPDSDVLAEPTYRIKPAGERGQGFLVESVDQLAAQLRVHLPPLYALPK